MTDTKGADRLDDLEDRLDRPISPTYPLRDNEIVGVWRRRSVEALHRLAHKGVLDRKDGHGRPLHENLFAIADGPLLAAFEQSPGRALLLGEVVRNVDAPGRITQGLKGTCAATCVEIHLAERDPAEYARLCAGLVRPEGRVGMRSGDELVRDEDVLVHDEHEFRRSPMSRLFQVACMEYAYPELDYRNGEDGHFEGAKNTGTGLSFGAFDRLLNAITGQRWDTVSDGHAKLAALFARFGVDTRRVPDLRRDALQIIDRTTAAGETLFATLEVPRVRVPVRRAAAPSTDQPLGQAAHKIRVLALDRPKGLVIYDDPMDPQVSWFEGVRTCVEDKYGRCTMAIEDFQKLVVELSYRPDLWQVDGEENPLSSSAPASTKVPASTKAPASSPGPSQARRA
jgi:hypothetical protein